MDTIVRQYLHRPNVTELGIGNTHETYMLVSKETDLSNMFPPGVEMNVEDSVSKKVYSLKSANGREFRINQMGPIYRDYAVRPGDEILITEVEKAGVSKLFFSVRNYRRVGLNVTKNGAELSNEEFLTEYVEGGDRNYSINVFDRGVSSKLIIRFKQSMKKRNDSPTETDYFEAFLGDIPLSTGSHYLTLSEKSSLTTVSKSDYNEIRFDDCLMNITSLPKTNLNLPLQQIFYGAPGTGKSHKTNEVTAKYPNTIRTTFHPDSDYSTFVGAYKPTTAMLGIFSETGEPATMNGAKLQKEQITYKFVKQAFLKAYIQAWKQYRDTAVEGKELAPQFLVIEEINRGNCAQIFGDLFQLLDRKNGFSEYPIEADEDIRKCLLQEDTKEDPTFGENGLDLSDPQKEYIDGIFDPKDGEKCHVANKICQGQVLVLPPNLYIWATMNTSDQSLFPIDSAFKRRWDWRYMRITNHKDEAWRIQFDYKDEEGNVQKEDTDWWEFLKAINKHIYTSTHSEDKQLGYFFCKANNKVVSAETFVGKVIFYLWNDVFKTTGYKSTVFTIDGNKVTFDNFYLDENDDEEDNPDSLDKLLVHKFIASVITSIKD